MGYDMKMAPSISYFRLLCISPPHTPSYLSWGRLVFTTTHTLPITCQARATWLVKHSLPPHKRKVTLTHIGAGSSSEGSLSKAKLGVTCLFLVAALKLSPKVALVTEA